MTVKGVSVARVRFEYLSESDKQFFHEQVVRVLEEVGVAYNTPTLTSLLAEAGATVDAERMTARIPWDLVERCLAQLPKQILLAGRDPAYDRRVGDGGMVYTSDGAATYMLDDVSGERHEGTRDDLRRMIALFDAIPEIDFVWATITPGDVDPRAGNLRDRARRLHVRPQAPAGRGPGPRPGAGLHRDAGGDRRGAPARAAHLLGDQLHDRSPAARPRDDRGARPHGEGRACPSSSCRCRRWARRGR